MDSLLHDRYKVVSKIGRGGSSQVYLCLDNHIHKKWAVKRISRKGHEKALADREIENLKSLDYYLFPRISDAFSDENYIYIVTDYIEGRSLEEVIKNRNPLPEGLVLSYMKELIKGIIYLHSQSPPVLYLDMKPSNIILRPDGSLRLIDFGIATNLIEDFKGMGTPGYAAPEQYSNDAILTEKADVFAFAMTAYSLLTGEKPYRDYETQINCIKKSNISNQIKELLLASTEYQVSKRLGTDQVNFALTKIIGNGRRVKVMLIGLFLIAAVFCISTFSVASIIRSNESRRYAEQMVGQAEKYLINGEYSPLGLKIICGYLDGNFLDEETAEYFTYEVARNYFEIQQDYPSARRYFLRLNKEKYPEVEYFLRLCTAMTAFGNEEEINRCLEDFILYNRTVKDDEKRRKNEELIDFLKISGGNR